jgi:hypothetical protein
VGLAGFNVDAFAIIDQSTLLLSFSEPGTVPGIQGSVSDSDVVQFTATSLRELTAGTFAPYFDGSDVGLADWVDVDALELLPNGRLLISTYHSFVVPGVSGGDGDILGFTPTALGDDTAGTWEMYFDGSDVGLGGRRADVDALAVDAVGELYLSTIGRQYLAGPRGEDEDVLICHAPTLGWDAGCTGFSIFFDGSEYGLAASDLSALELP